jgi:hypothetical protein
MAAFPLAAPSHIHRVWLSDDSSAKLAEEVQQSLILIGDKDIVLSEVLDGLQTAFPSATLWVARYLGNCRYQVQGSEQWRRDMIQAGSIILRQHYFRVSTDLSCLYAPSNSVKAWIKILDLDYDMWSYQGLADVTQPFASLLDLDFPTRVYIEVADLSLLPPFLWFEVRRPNGWISYIKIRYELVLCLPSRTSSQLLLVYTVTNRRLHLPPPCL